MIKPEGRRSAPGLNLPKAAGANGPAWNAAPSVPEEGGGGRERKNSRRLQTCERGQRPELQDLIGSALGAKGHTLLLPVARSAQEARARP